MNALVLQEPFFAPVESKVIAGLIDEYNAERLRIDQISALVRTEARSAIAYFLRGNCRENRTMPDVTEVFAPKGAIGALNSDYWQRALDLTDVLSIMPQARRDVWFKAIHDFTTPEFSVASVYPTIEQLLVSRSQYFQERVDGIFRALSGDHVSNQPLGFTKRMILSNVYSDYGSPNSSQAGIISDLRSVVAKFMGRDEPRWNVTYNDLNRLKCKPGQWQALDGSAIRVRVYKCGTAHLEIHTDMANRLNGVLHSMHPHAIPASRRQPNKKPSKSFEMMARPLPFAVLGILRDLRPARDGVVGTLWSLRGESRDDKRAFAEAVQVVETLGGVLQGRYEIRFDYDATEVLNEVILSGCIPDRRSHQFYPTPPAVAAEVLKAAQIGDRDRCLEPSAGQGGLATLMPLDRTVCIEISALHCAVLTSKGCRVEQRDFLEWAQGTSERFDRICMNPPFADGRARSHVEAAAGLLKPGGRLVAVLPASMRDKLRIEDLKCTWSEAMTGEFDHTGVSVAVATVVRPAVVLPLVDAA